MYPPSWEKDNRQPQTALQSGCQVVLGVEAIWWLYALLNWNNLDTTTSIFLFVSPVITLLALISLNKSVWRTLGIIIVILFTGAMTIFYVAIALLLQEPPLRAFRNNQHEKLHDGRCVDLIFKGHDATDGSFLVQTSKGNGPFKETLKSRPLALTAEPDLRILPNGQAVIFIKNATGKESSPIGVDEFLEGVAEVPDYK